MCGFVGVLNLDGAPAERAIIAPMIRSLSHRGPDAEGLFCAGAVGLGHRRLAIVDPTRASDQPMVSTDTRYVLVYNGCVYNFRELRTELESLGHVFRTQGDTEVVLQACVRWGAGGVERFNGMFALALWDTETHALLLARDRYGMKPLYYSAGPRVFLFGSEIKALLRHPAQPARLCPSALEEYFEFQNVLSDQTLFEGIRLLPPGCTLVLRTDGARVPEPVRYWDFDFREEPTLDAETCHRTVRALVEQAVERQLIGDASIGSHLSGGIDSGTVAAVARTRLPALTTFTCGFDVTGASAGEQPFDERRAAADLSRRLGTHHHEVVAGPDDVLRLMGALTWHLEEPRLGQSCPNYLLAGLARTHVRVALSGAGGDELFAGYPWRYDRHADPEFHTHHFDRCRRLVPAAQVGSLLRPEARARDPGHTRRVFDAVHARRDVEGGTAAENVNRVLAFDARTFLHGLLLVEDKLAMAHGLEIRAPLLDNDLVDFAMRIPVRHKLGAAWWAGDDALSGGKAVLRRVFAALVPGGRAGGPKQGFSAPDASWFRHESATRVQALLDPATARIYEYLQPETVQGLLRQHMDGGANHRMLIWSLMSMEFWFRTFL